MDQRYTSHKHIAIPPSSYRTLSWFCIALLVLPFAAILFASSVVDAVIPMAGVGAPPRPIHSGYIAPALYQNPVQAPEDRVLRQEGPSAIPATLAADPAPNETEEPSNDILTLLSTPLLRFLQPKGVAFADANAREPLCIFGPPVPPPQMGCPSATVAL